MITLDLEYPFSFLFDYDEKVIDLKEERRVQKCSFIIKRFLHDMNRETKYYCTCHDDDYIEYWVRKNKDTTLNIKVISMR